MYAPKFIDTRIPRLSQAIAACLFILNLAVVSVAESQANSKLVDHLPDIPPKAACSARGAIDRPATIGTDQLVIAVEGWVASPDGIDRVELRSEGRLIEKSKPSLQRADVRQVFSHCSYPDRLGFAVPLSLGALEPTTESVQLFAIDGTAREFLIGELSVDLSQPFGAVDTLEPIKWDATNVVGGWALGTGAATSAFLRAGDRVVAQRTANVVRNDVAAAYPAWSGATRSGYEFIVSMRQLPRGSYPLQVDLVDDGGGRRTLEGPKVINDAPIGSVIRSDWLLLNPDTLDIKAWLADEDGIAGAELTLEDDTAIGPMQLTKRAIPFLLEYARLYGIEHEGAPLVDKGDEYVASIKTDLLPEGLSRIGVRVWDTEGRKSWIAGPLILRRKTRVDRTCIGEKFRVFMPADTAIFRNGFPEMQDLRRLVEGGCVEIGVSGRVEYLRTTKGVEADFQFDPDFPDSLRNRREGEMTTTSLNELLATADTLNVPLRITLDGAVWADSKFAAPDVDVVDWLESDERTVQWNQYGRAEADDSLQDLPGSYSSPQLARMMSLNHYNERFRFYKKRNLQSAATVIRSYMEARSDRYVGINLDPDQYINPWFFQTQWYDYNPDTLRQFRDWLFHIGLYADGQELAAYRYQSTVTLRRINELAGEDWSDQKEVEPPRTRPVYEDPWQHIWVQFKRHLVAKHYEDLTDWLVQSGIAKTRIYTSQTFIQSDVAVTLNDPARDWTDQAGVSIEGAKPKNGRLGAILYGPASRGEGQSRRGLGLLQNLRRMDRAWGVVEFQPATISFPERLPSHEQAYSSVGRVLNAGAHFLTPMWGSRISDRVIFPDHFRSYDAFTGTAFEYQLVWWLLLRQSHPVGSLVYPFGNAMVKSFDQWTSGPKTKLEVGLGELTLRSTGPVNTLYSPRWEPYALDRGMTIELQGRWNPKIHPAVDLILTDGHQRRIVCKSSAGGDCSAVYPPHAAQRLSALKIHWQAPHEQGREPVLLDKVAIRFKPSPGL